MRAGDGSAGEGRAAADVRRKSSGAAGDDEPGSAVPGAFVAVIFGIFGVLVIGRRSRR